MASIPNVRKSRGRPKVGATHIGLRLPPEQLASLDAFVEAYEGQPSRPQAIRVILADWLRTHGFAEHDIKASGPATDVVKAMDAAIEKHRKSGAANKVAPRGK